jgi:LPS-assembly protein
VLSISNSSANTLDKNEQNESLPQKLQILAKKIETKNNIIIASDNVLVHSPNYYITAQKVIYNRDKSTLELFDNVNIIKDGKTTTFSDYAFLDFSKEINMFTPILLIDSKSNIWVNSKKATRDNDLLSFKGATLSSCDCYDPAWSISFSNGDYNSSQEWINTYNATLFINKVPVLYTPYFGFPNDKTRRSGLLKPTIGWSNNEGLLLIQPIFYAPALNWDIEYTPQLRTKRGDGHYLQYRLKDSEVSSLDIQTGIFREKDSYFDQSLLRNNKHYGWDLKYQISKLISDDMDDTKDGLLVSLHSLNDIDYINTKPNSDGDTTNKLIKSQIKYFYNTAKAYGNIDFKYYKDTSKINNDTTMQELPEIYLHKYSSETIIDNLFYSSSFKYANKFRKEGLRAKTVDVIVPLTYSFSSLDDYLNILISSQLNMTHIDYSNTINSYTNGEFIENKNTLSLWTDLLKPYKDHIHTINFKTSFTIPNIVKQGGDLYSINSTESDLSAFPVSKTHKHMSFTFNQSLYNKDSLSQTINHKIYQSVIYNEDGGSKLSDLENELIYYYKYGTLSNRLLFNHQENMIINSSSSISFNKNDFKSNVYYSYSKDTSTVSSNSQSYSYKDLLDAEALNVDLSYKFNKYYTIGYQEEYDIETKTTKDREYTLDIDKKCWKLNLKVADNLVASSTTNNEAIRQNIFYIQLTLKPILTFNQKYIQKAK